MWQQTVEEREARRLQNIREGIGCLHGRVEEPCVLCYRAFQDAEEEDAAFLVEMEEKLGLEPGSMDFIDTADLDRDRAEDDGFNGYNAG